MLMPNGKFESFNDDSCNATVVICDDGCITVDMNGIKAGTYGVSGLKMEFDKDDFEAFALFIADIYKAQQNIVRD